MSSKKIKNIIHNNILYSTIFDISKIQEGLEFITEDSAYIQVGTWNYTKGKVLDAHYHNKFERESLITQEVVFVIKGKVTCNLYTESGDFIESIEINQNQLIIQYEGVHEYEINEDTKVLEIKNGPYLGPEKDRTRVNVRKN